MKKKIAPFAKTQFELVGSPVVAEFLGFRNKTSRLENNLGSAALSHIRDFLIKMGRGFAFVAGQRHMMTETEDCFIDIAFCDIESKRYAPIDLKIGRIMHRDV